MKQLEIERKFLVSQVPERLLENAPNSKIEQGYLILESSHELRIRKRGNEFWMTLKQGNGLERSEQECRISAEQFSLLWPLTKGQQIEKTRYLVEQKEHLLEIDIFSGALSPLVMLEVEFSSVEASQEFRIPDFATKEVTEDKAYKNATLAVCGLP